MGTKPSKTEDEFFAREEAEKLHRLHVERLKQHDAQKAEDEKKAHWMKCPKCGYGLEVVRWRNIDVDKCFRCGCVALDSGEIEKLAGHEQEEGFVKTFIGLFKP